MISKINTKSPIDGGEFTERVLMDPSGGVEELIKLANFQETEWLEFKAALGPKPKQQLKENENIYDYYWRVAKAIISLTNTRGGVVFLGIDDSGNPVGISSSDPQNILIQRGTDAFIRQIIDQAIRPKAGWKTKRYGHFGVNYEYLQQNLSCKLLNYRNQKVLVFIIRPIQEDQPLLIVEQTQPVCREILLVRDLGQVGRVRELWRGHEVESYRQNRVVSTAELANLWQKFIKSISLKEIQANLELENSITNYNEILMRTPVFHFLDKTFTPLEAENTNQGLMEGGFFELRLVKKHFDLDDAWTDSIKNNGYDSVGQSKVKKDFNQLSDLPKENYVLDLIDKIGKFILIGKPGSGKTVCLQRYCLNNIKNYKSGKTATIFVPLASYRDNQSLLTLITRVSGLSYRHVKLLLENKRIFLLLDAFNECPIHLQDRCIQEIDNLLVEWPNCQIIITSRTSMFLDRLGLPIFKIKPLTREQQKHFLSIYLGGDSDLACTILNDIDSHGGLKSIFDNPWMLRMIATIYEKEKTLTFRRTMIYRRYFSAWYNRESMKAKNSGTPLPWTEKEIMYNLSRLSAEMIKNGYRKQAPIYWIDKVFSHAWFNEGGFVERLGQSLLFFYSIEDDRFSFLHESLQEFFACEHFVRDPEKLKQIAQDRIKKVVFKYNLEKHISESDLDLNSKIFWFFFTCISQEDEDEAVYETVQESEENFKLLTDHLKGKIREMRETNQRAFYGLLETRYNFLSPAFESSEDLSPEFLDAANLYNPLFVSILKEDNEAFERFEN